MIDDNFIQSCKKQLWIINTGRGKTLVTADLVKALKAGKVIGAGLDVLEYEKASFETISKDNTPEDFKFLLENDRVLLSPHVAGWTFESHQKLAQTIVDKVQKHFF
jgi:D-3-phosphoglycerate dehydrogenase